MIGYTNSTASKPMPGEYINVRLLTNQSSHSDLNGIAFTVEYEGQSKDYVWEGSEVTVLIPADMEYTVVFKGVEGYKTPESVTYTAVAENARDIEALYQCELLTVNVSADEGEVSGFEVKITGRKTLGEVLPEGFTPLEYIESTGSQYIDTGFIPNQDTGMTIKMTCPVVSNATTWAFGARTSASSNMFGFVASSSGYYMSQYGTVIDNLPTSYNTSDPFILKKDKSSTYINEVLVATASAQTFTCPVNLTLCAMNNNGTVNCGKIKLYYCQIYDNGKLIRDYVPALNSEGVAGLYDKQNNKFYASASSTAFVAGNEAVYTQVEYIESTGAQYIDTGFKPNQDTRVVMDVQCLIEGSNYFLFGARTNNNNNNNAALTYGFNAYSTFYRSHYYNGWKDFSTSVKFTDRFILDKNKNVTTIGGSNVITHTYTTFQCAYNMYLFAANTAGTEGTFGKAKLYSCQIYDNGTLVRDFVPVKRSDGMAGLYDKVNKAFYASASSTAFVAGAELLSVNITQTTASATHKIPFGVKYTVSASGVDGFTAPASQSFIAAESVRNLSMIYKERILGIFIQDIDGNLWKPEDWDNSATADLVAVLTEECSFGVFLTTWNNDVQISNTYDLALDNYMTAITDIESAKTDYDGVINTANIMKMETSTDCAAGFCTKWTSPSGKKGFLSAFGQLYIIYNNKDAINNALTIAGGRPLNLYGENTYWSSTFSGIISMDGRACWSLDFSNGDCFSHVCINAYYKVIILHSLD